MSIYSTNSQLSLLSLLYDNFADVVDRLILSGGNKFILTDIAPVYFAKIRSLSGINPQEYAAAFRGTSNEKFSEGRSGAFMFTSKKGK